MGFNVIIQAHKGSGNYITLSSQFIPWMTSPLQTERVGLEMETWLSSSAIHLENELNQISLQVYLNLSCYCRGKRLSKNVVSPFETLEILQTGSKAYHYLINHPLPHLKKKKSLCLTSLAPMWPSELHGEPLSRLISQSALMTYKQWHAAAFCVLILSTSWWVQI